MIDAAVLGVVFLHHFVLFLAVAHGLPCAFKGVDVQGDGVREVEHVAHLSVLEQRGVALGGDLLNLPLHGWQQHLVFARIGVGRDHHAVDGGVHLGFVFVFLIVIVGLLMQEHLVARGLVAVIDVEHQSRGVVAL